MITQTLRALQTAKLVSVTVGKQDARSKSVTLTKVGREKLTRVLPGYYDVIQRFMATRAG